MFWLTFKSSINRLTGQVWLVSPNNQHPFNHRRLSEVIPIPSEKMLKRMVIFDFDRTIIDGDSDRWVVTQMGLTPLFDQLASTLPWNSLMVSPLPILNFMFCSSIKYMYFIALLVMFLGVYSSLGFKPLNLLAIT